MKSKTQRPILLVTFTNWFDDCAIESERSLWNIRSNLWYANLIFVIAMGGFCWGFWRKSFARFFFVYLICEVFDNRNEIWKIFLNCFFFKKKLHCFWIYMCIKIAPSEGNIFKNSTKFLRSVYKWCQSIFQVFDPQFSFVGLIKTFYTFLSSFLFLWPFFPIFCTFLPLFALLLNQISFITTPKDIVQILILSYHKKLPPKISISKTIVDKHTINVHIDLQSSNYLCRK